MWATIAKHFSLNKQIKYKFHPISYRYQLFNKSRVFMTYSCNEYCNEMLRLSVKYAFLQFMEDFKAFSLISNVIYKAMTTTFCPLYREFPYFEFSYLEKT